MALTKNEALERAAAIWGKMTTLSVSSDWATYSTLELSGGNSILIFTDDVAHQLDANGHPTCHRVCKQLETIAYERKLLK